MTPSRLKIEQTILAHNFPGRAQVDDTRHRAEVQLRSSSGADYAIEIHYGPDYPNHVPVVHLVRPALLRDFRGENLALISPSHAMHLLEPRGRHVQLCHYKVENWHPNVTLYKVALKCLIWLEAYENHLRTGRPLVYYLGV